MTEARNGAGWLRWVAGILGTLVTASLVAMAAFTFDTNSSVKVMREQIRELDRNIDRLARQVELNQADIRAQERELNRLELEAARNPVRR